MSDRGAIGKRLPPEPAPAPDPTDTFEGMLDAALSELGVPDETYPANVANAVEWIQKAKTRLERVGAVIDAALPRPLPLELVYIPEQHRLHAAPKEECNTDASTGKRKIREADLAKVSPDVALCEHCVSEQEARVIRAGLRRT